QSIPCCLHLYRGSERLLRRTKPGQFDERASMSGPVIEISGLTKTYRSGFRRQAVHAVRNLNLRIEPNSIVAFVGPNGAGKTTTIQTLLGLLMPDEGSVSIFGRPASDASTRSQVGYQSEIFYTYKFHTASKALRF